MGANNKIKEGEISKNNFGTEYIMTGYTGYRKVGIKFLDSYGFETIIDSWEFRRGNVVNPYDRKVYGVGYIGDGPFSNPTHPQARSRWGRMLDRCYSNKKEFETYTGCEVAAEWHNFQTFAEWYENNIKIFRDKGIAVALDKDLLSGDLRGKLYSKDTCCLLPCVFNSNVSMPLKTGVVYKEPSYFAHNCKNSTKIINGPFETYTEAHSHYIKTRQEIFMEYLDEYKELLSENVILKLKDFYITHLKG